MDATPPRALSSFNFADVWEAVADRVGDRTAVLCRDTRRSYTELEERSNRLANWMIDRGVEPGDFVALYLTNSPAYFEAMLAAYKVRAVPVNVNHRYVERELQQVLADAGAVGVLYDVPFASRLAAVVGELPTVRWCIAVEDAASPAGTAPDADTRSAMEELGDQAYEAVLAGSDGRRPTIEGRSDEDLYVIYTGGTTGLPKGVEWRQADAFFACIGGGDPMRLQGAVERPEQLLDRIIDGSFVFLPVAPLMHAAGQWTSLSYLFAGGTVVLVPGPLDPLEVWRTIESQQVNLITVVGDAVVRPLLDAWAEAGPFEVGSLFSIGSGGAPLSPALRARLMETLPDCVVVDGFGSSETGAQGSQRLAAGSPPATGVTRFTPYGDTTTVVDESTLAELPPGSEQTGRVARRGHIPLRYHNDPDKTAATFFEADGHRWVLTGDVAVREADGTIRLMGRGSQCINTGGEKVFPEEVESVLKAHPAVYDAVVVGVPDERWGQRVTAVVQPTGTVPPSEEELREHCRASLAGYKVPKSVIVVPLVERSPAGKPDYRWARATAERAVRG